MPNSSRGSFKKHNLANKLVLLKDGAEALDFLFAEGRPATSGTDAIPE